MWKSIGILLGKNEMRDGGLTDTGKGTSRLVTKRTLLGDGQWVLYFFSLFPLGTCLAAICCTKVIYLF